MRMRMRTTHSIILDVNIVSFLKCFLLCISLCATFKLKRESKIKTVYTYIVGTVIFNPEKESHSKL